MAHNATYSFLDVNAVLSSPAGSVLLSENGIANEGITISQNERVTTTWGADGEWMHSLHGAKGGRVTIRVQKTGKLNADLSRIFAFDTQSSANTGQATISVIDNQRGDHWTVTGAALVKLPDVNYATEGGTVEWTFTAGQIDGLFGTGTPEADILPVVA